MTHTLHRDPTEQRSTAELFAVLVQRADGALRYLTRVNDDGHLVVFVSWRAGHVAALDWTQRHGDPARAVSLRTLGVEIPGGALEAAWEAAS